MAYAISLTLAKLEDVILKFLLLVTVILTRAMDHCSATIILLTTRVKTAEQNLILSPLKNQSKLIQSNIAPASILSLFQLSDSPQVLVVA